MSVLAEHIGHQAVLRDERHLRCLDCNRTLVLPAPAASSSTTSTSTSPLPLNHPDACTHHPGQRQETCGPCRAEQLETQRTHQHTPTADVAAGAAAARAALADLRQRRATTDTEENA